MANIESRPQVVIAISGGGTTMKSVLEASRELPVDVVGIFASTAKAEGLEKARKLDFPENKLRVINPYHFKDAEGNNDRKQYGDAISDFMREVGADSVAQLGFIPIMPSNVVENARWVINQHPGPLDPGRLDSVTKEQLDFGGKGMRGSAVTCARLAYLWATGENYWTEATVHYVTPDEQHDKGGLIATTRLDIPWATPSVRGWTKGLGIGEVWTRLQDDLRHLTFEAQRDLLPLEHTNVIEALMQFNGGKTPEGRTREIPLITPGQGREYTLYMAKDLAVKIFPKG